ncbi:MAG: hypothetical protein JWO13_598 [Acidobacteriales bacterium]|nr:hypothetical protein [Terriglobales bacterium]
MKIFTQIAILLMFGSMTSLVAVGQAAQPFSISINALKGDIKFGEPIEIRVTITNTSGRDLDVSSSWEAGTDVSLEFDVRDTSGNPLRRKARREGPESLSVKTATLKPGETIKETTLVSAHYMDEPGQYVIQLARRVSTDAKQGKVKSNKITVTVTP